ncbi:MAG: metallophosphoesterase [Kangiellaceae bacterium]
MTFVSHKTSIYCKLLFLFFVVLGFISNASASAESNSNQGSLLDLSEVKFTTEEDIFVVGDIHGAYENIVSSLQTIKLIDEQHNWIGGKSQFVSLGDLMDRGPASRKVMDLFIKLQQQAHDNGGRFLMVLGNHEVMNLIGDLRYLSNEEINEFADDETNEQRDNAYTAFLESNNLQDSTELKSKFDESYPKGYFARLAAFSPEGYYGSWLLKLPFVIQINKSLFAHGGLSKLVEDFSLEEFNQEAKNGLTKYLKVWSSIAKKEELSRLTPYKQRGELISSLNNRKVLKRYTRAKSHFILNSQGPTWYRGNALCHPYFEQELLASNLTNWDANELWVGHTTSQSRKPLKRLDGMLKIIDTGMLSSHYKGVPWVGKISNSNNTEFIQGLTGETGEVTSAPAREWSNPFNMSDSQVEEFVEKASIEKIGTTKEGKTKPYKVKLTLGSKSIYGIFKYYDSTRSPKNASNRKKRYETDRYQHEIAAYKLDRRLGIGLVPVTVFRKFNGREGIIQIWVNDLISELEMTEKNIPYDGYCDFKSQDNFLNAFDYLIANRDRNQSNVLFTKSDMQIWFIDHSRAFGIKSKRPRNLKGKDIKISSRFKAELKQLNINNLQILKPWLKERQIYAILKRRDKMLKEDI